MRILLGILLSISISSASWAEAYLLIEHPNAQDPKQLIDSFKVHYQQDDFTDKVSNVQIIYAPRDFRHQAGYVVDCGAYLSSFEVVYVDQADQLKEDGELTNLAPKFEKFGFIYNDNQALTVKSGEQKMETEVYVGGQTRYLSKYFKVNFPQTPGLLGMNFHFEYVNQNTPVETSRETKEGAAEFMDLLKQALKKGQVVDFYLEAENGHQRHFQLDAARMAKFVPPEVLDFCFFDRKLKVE